MKILKLLTIFVPSLFILSGCGNGFSDKNYSYESNETDPTLIFKSDYKGYTYFWLNNDLPSEERLCANTHPIGYLLQSDSIFIFEKNITTLNVKVPAEKEITITGSFIEGNGGCGPIDKAFVPEKNKNYIIQYEEAGNYCRLNIIDKATGDDISAKKVKKCIK